MTAIGGIRVYNFLNLEIIMSRHSFTLRTLILALVLLQPKWLYAQDFGNIVGGIVGNAMRIAAAQEAWRKMPPNMTRCVDISLHMRGNNLQNFINAGITPSDYRISQLTNLCRIFANDLSLAVPCTVDNGTGVMVQSTCRELYIENGTNRALSFNEAVEFANNGVRFSIGRSETTEAIKRREFAAKVEADRMERQRQQAQAEADHLHAQTKAAWDDIPATLLNCLTTGLAATPLNPQKAIDTGILPSDQRYNSYKVACADINAAMANQGTAQCERPDQLQNTVSTQCQWAWHIKDPLSEEPISTDEAMRAWLGAIYARKNINVEYALIEPKDVRTARLIAAENSRQQNLRERDAHIAHERAMCVTPRSSWFHFFGAKPDETLRLINNISHPLNDMITTTATYLIDHPDDKLARTSLAQRLDYEADKIATQKYASAADLLHAITSALADIKPLTSICSFDLTDAFTTRIISKSLPDAFASARLLKKPTPELADTLMPLLQSIPTSAYPREDRT
jgi:hypothetical protein